MRVSVLVFSLAVFGCRGDNSDKLTDSDPESEPQTSDTEDTAVEDPDADGDGVPASADCDDSDNSVYPDADEVCDGVDNDCDDAVDDEDDDLIDGIVYYVDSDGDGYGDEEDTTIACALPSGHATESGDCDDADRTINPSAVEVCDELDNDCSGLADDDAIDADTWYADGDEDGFGDPDTAVDACEQPSGYLADDSDCDDADDDVNPDGTEVCDGVEDEDCDGTVDEDGAADGDTFYEDDDGDGFGDANDTTTACEAPSGYVADATDCDDGDADANPNGTETCDGLADEDCDGTVDEDGASDAATFYEDDDGDGFGDAGDTTTACEAPSGYVADDSDCDDGNATIQPNGTEVCDGDDDEDCDGDVDEDGAADVETFYADSDSDGFGDVAVTTESCEAPTGYVADDSDCDDAVSSINPDADEVCDGTTDEDCDGDIDEDSASDASTWYLDADSDGYGDADRTTVACDQPSVYVDDDQDCDDLDSSINPDGTEVCDGSNDEDCDGTVDEDGAEDALTWYADADGDGFGDIDSTTEACEEPSGYTDDDSDCHDDDATAYPESTYPDVPEDGVDQNCDGYDGCTDMDCDGLPDLVIAEYYDGNYSTEGLVYFGDGEFADSDAESFTSTGSYDVEVADLDGDGFQDVVTATHYDGSSYKADSYVYYGTITGLDTTNRVDLPTLGALDVEIGDLDQDGYDDLVFANFRSSTTDFTVDSYVYYGAATGFSTSNRDGLATNGARQVKIHDVDSDGYDDLIFCNDRDSRYDWQTNSYVYYGASTGFSTSNRDSLPTVLCRGVAVSDIDGDGYAEIAFANYRNNSYDYTINSYIYYGSSTGYSSSNRDDVATDGAIDVDFGDLDMDGTDDVIFTGYYTGSWSSTAYTDIYYYNSGFSSTDHDAISSKGAHSTAIDDLDEDGYNDLIIARYYSGSTQNTSSWVYYGSSTGFSSSNLDSLPTLGAQTVTIADLDDDGYKELLFGNYYTGSSYAADSYIYYGSATGYSSSDRTSLDTYAVVAPVAVVGDVEQIQSW